MQMKQLITLILITFSASSVLAYDEINLTNSGHQVRFGGFFANGTHVSFREVLKIELAKRNVQIEERHGDVILSYKFIFNSSTLYRVFPKAKMRISVKKDNLKVSQTFSCAPEINDGGNLTIKKRCAVKTARKMKKLLLEQDIQF